MPKLNKDTAKHRLAESNITSTRVLAEITDIPWGSLKNGLAGRDPLTLARIYRIAERIKRRPNETVRDVVTDLLAANEGVPDEPPKKPRREPTAPPKRKDTEKTAPKRLDGVLAEAS